MTQSWVLTGPVAALPVALQGADGASERLKGHQEGPQPAQEVLQPGQRAYREGSPWEKQRRKERMNIIRLAGWQERFSCCSSCHTSSMNYFSVFSLASFVRLSTFL